MTQGVPEDRAESAGVTGLTHEWKRDGNGDVDEWALDADYEGVGHNGPRCVRCDFAFCEHCEPDGWNDNDCDPEEVIEGVTKLGSRPKPDTSALPAVRSREST